MTLEVFESFLTFSYEKIFEVPLIVIFFGRGGGAGNALLRSHSQTIEFAHLQCTIQ